MPQVTKGIPSKISFGRTRLSILLHIIRATIAKGRTGVNIRDLAEAHGIQINAVFEHVKALNRLGLIKHDNMKARTMIATCTVYVDCLPPEPPDAKTQRSDPAIPSSKKTKRNVARKG